jgi:hypothetical protein
MKEYIAITNLQFGLFLILLFMGATLGTMGAVFPFVTSPLDVWLRLVGVLLLIVGNVIILLPPRWFEVSAKNPESGEENNRLVGDDDLS